jgi:hypothetical protein
MSCKCKLGDTESLNEVAARMGISLGLTLGLLWLIYTIILWLADVLL